MRNINPCGGGQNLASGVRPRFDGRAQNKAHFAWATRESVCVSESRRIGQLRMLSDKLLLRCYGRALRSGGIDRKAAAASDASAAPALRGFCYINTLFLLTI